MQKHEHNVTGPAILAGITAAQWNALASKRVYFGHQSVGNNMLDGVRDVLAQHPSIALRIADAGAGEPATAAGLYHGKVGRNGDPASKNAAFAAAVRSLAPDVAILKYCYVDVSATTDPSALFAEYRRQMASLREERRGMLLVHATMPLTTVGGAREWLASKVRRTATSRDVNAIRSTYNRLLRETFGGKEPIFDLARIESTRSGGATAGFTRRGETVQALAPEFTDDGGHLNAAGRRAAAEEFLGVLARL